ncbi:MAG: M15 family metallopeptidase [Acetobacteraceae bacterium]
MSSGLFDDDIRFYQKVLRLAGHHHDTIDGIWGRNTEDADKAFHAEYEAIRNSLGTFDPRSEGNIRTLLPAAQRAARTFLKTATSAMNGKTLKILSGTRTYAEQDAIFAKGRNGVPGPIVSNARGGQSNHNFGIAWDVGLFDGGRYMNGAMAGDEDAYKRLADVAMMPSLEWGGAWTSFVDRPHYQLRTGLALAQVRTQFDDGTLQFA